MIKRGLDLILDVVEAARVRIDSMLPPQPITIPELFARTKHITDLLVQALVETKRLIDERPKLSQLSNEKGSRRIIAVDYAVHDRTIEIRESTIETPEELSVLFMSRSPIQLDAQGLFELAKAILTWFGFEPTRASDLGADGEAIAEWLRVEAQGLRTEAGQLDRPNSSGQAQRAAVQLEAKADDYEELAARISTGAWKVKPS
jgi:hypothetical protein